MPWARWILLLAAPVWAHDIAGDVRVQSYWKPEGQTLRVVLRAPLKAMRDIEFPVRGTGFLDVERAEPYLRDAVTMWITSAMEVYEDGARVGPARVAGVKASIESDKSFAAYRDALAHVLEASPAIGDVPVEQVMLDTVIEYPIRSARSEFAVRPKLDRLGMTVVTVLWYLPPEGTLRAFEYTGDAGLVRLDPRWHQAALTFVKLGFAHILEGIDHLLFLLCLVIPFRKFGQLLLIVTSFTVAHSITLLASALNYAPGVLWFPPLIETGIAASILYMALENIVGGVGVNRRWVITFAFGLVHGFGFSFALHETLQFAGSHLAVSLAAFNVGVELGQLLVLAVFVPALALLFRYVVAERMGTIVLSALVAHTAWHWMVERAEELGKFF